MSENLEIKKILGSAFLEIADAIQTGKFGSRVRVGLTTLGSEHGVDNLVKGAELAARDADYDIVLIGPKCDTSLEVVEINSEDDMHGKLSLIHISEPTRPY